MFTFKITKLIDALLFSWALNSNNLEKFVGLIFTAKFAAQQKHEKGI